jgi:hypothetical protein
MENWFLHLLCAVQFSLFLASLDLDGVQFGPRSYFHSDLIIPSSLTQVGVLRLGFPLPRWFFLWSAQEQPAQISREARAFFLLPSASRSFSFSALASWPRPFLFACAPRIARCPHRSVPRVGFSCSRQKGAGQFSSPSSSRSVCAQARIWPGHFLSCGCSTSKLCLFLVRSSRFDFAALQLWLGFF